MFVGVAVAVPLAFPEGVTVDGHGRDVHGDAVVVGLEQLSMCLRVLCPL